MSLHNLQNVLCNLARIRIRFRVRIRVRVGVRSEICKLRMHNFEIAQHILQIVQTDKLRETGTS